MELEKLKVELEKKEKRFEKKYVLNPNNNYLSDEAEQWRKEIFELRRKISFLEKTRSADRLVIGIDRAEGKDHTCLNVARRIGSTRGYQIINEFQDEEAEEIYKKLTGGN